MNFFDAQDKARRATRWLVVVYILSTGLIVAGVTTIVGAVLYSTDQSSIANGSILGATAILATLLILGATLYKTSVLSGGGSRVALDMGGTLIPTDVTEPLRFDHSPAFDPDGVCNPDKIFPTTRFCAESNPKARGYDRVPLGE